MDHNSDQFGVPDENPTHHSKKFSKKKLGGNISVPLSVYIFLSVLSIMFMSLIVIVSYFSSPQENSYNEEGNFQWIASALFEAQDRDVVLGWRCSPVRIIYNHDTSQIIASQTMEVIEQISQSSGIEIQLVSENEWRLMPSDCDKIFIGFSSLELSNFASFYSRVFRSTFGSKDYEYWSREGAFDFNYSTQNPCFGFGVYSTNDYYTDGYVRNNEPEFAVIAVGNTALLPENLLLQCIREELAHMIFFIPDRNIDDGSESIFNKNFVVSEIDDFSVSDITLMKFLTENSEVIGLSQTELVKFIDAYATGVNAIVNH